MEVNVYKQDGVVAGTRTLNERIFEAPYSPHMLQEAVKVYLANQRAGTLGADLQGQPVQMDGHSLVSKSK